MPKPSGADIRYADGQFDFVGGVDSGRIPIMASAKYPNGLRQNQTAWLTNATVRGGGILQRTGWRPIVQGQAWPGLFQGAFMYEPPFADPHLILSIGGKIYRVRLDTDNSVQNLSASTGLSNPPTLEKNYFTQGEMFLVIQPGDNVTNPLFYDYNAQTNQTNMRRSNGFIAPGNGNNEIPAAGPMDYFGNRLWYGFGRAYAAGDIVGSKVTGTATYGYRDSILHVTENPIAKAGDAFIVPTNAGNIRALKHTANLDTALGQSPLFVMTRNAVYLADIPLNRDAWSDPTVAVNSPIQRVGLLGAGTYSDRSVVSVKNDMFYGTTPNGDILSFAMALRYFQQNGNLPISRNENRVLRFNDRSLLHFASGIEFDNRLWETVLPIQTPVGVAHQGIMPLDFDVLSSLEGQLPKVWEGMYEGLDILQMVRGDFGGLDRAFAIVHSRKSGSIEIWEMTLADRFDRQVGNDGTRVTWAVEFPGYTWGDPAQFKELVGGALWIDKLLGEVNFRLQYRPDQWPCWIDWTPFTLCTAKDCLDTFDTACHGYPLELFCEAFDPDMEFPKPPVKCVGNKNKRPSNLGYSFQARLLITGWCRIRGFVLYMEPKLKQPYDNLVCPS